MLIPILFIYSDLHSSFECARMMQYIITYNIMTAVSIRAKRSVVLATKCLWRTPDRTTHSLFACYIYMISQKETNLSLIWRLPSPAEKYCGQSVVEPAWKSMAAKVEYEWCATGHKIPRKSMSNLPAMALAAQASCQNRCHLAAQTKAFLAHGLQSGWVLLQMHR